MPVGSKNVLCLWADDFAIIQELTCTPTGRSVTCCMSCRRLDQLLKRYERGELHAVDWMDPLALKKIELLRQQVPPVYAETAGQL